MYITEQRKSEIIRIAQQTFKSKPEADEEFAALPLEELRQVDEMIGDREVNAGYRIRIRNRIKELEEKHRTVERRTENAEVVQDQRKYEKGVRIWGLVAAFVVGILVTIIGQWLWGVVGGGT